MDWYSTFGFVVLSVAMLGSPGPGIAALMLAGQSIGLRGSQPFFWGMQTGLAAAAAITAAGLLSLITTYPTIWSALTLASGLYLAWVGWKIGMSDLALERANGRLWSFGAGVGLGLLNPKVFLAYLTLFSSRAIISDAVAFDTLAKLTIVAVTALIVDWMWLFAGARLTWASPQARRALAVCLAALVIVMAIASMIEELQRIAMRS